MADLIESLKTVHQQTEHVVEVLRKACSQLSLAELSTECIQLSATLKDSKQSLTSLRSPEVPVEQLKKYTKEQLLLESAGLEARLSSSSTRLEAEMKEKLKKLETRLLELDCAPSGESRMKGDGGIKKVMNRISDFESQVGSQLQAFTQDVEKKLSFMSSRRTAEEPEDALSRELDALRYDVGELKDLLSGAKGDTAQVKRIVLACERDMEDFTAAMDAVNVDLDEMRARVDSTHSIITSRQRVEATVTAEISTMRLDMGDMQEALKAHDAWMEDVSQSLQEVHERCEGLAEQITTVEHGLKAKLEGKTDIAAWNDMNDDIDQSIRTVRDMASSLRFEVDSRRRRVDEELLSIRAEVSSLEEKMNSKTSELLRSASEQQSGWAEGLEAHQKHSEAIEAALWRHAEQQQVMQSKMDGQKEDLELRLSLLDANVQKQGEELSKSSLERLEALEAQQGRAAGEASKALRAMELRLAALQGASGECRRDLQRLREEANNLTVKSAAHDVDVAKNSDDLRKMERQRVEDDQRHKQEFDAIYEELDSKVAEKSHQRLEENASKLTRGVVKLCQVVGVFPGARMNDGTEEELDVDVELLNWEDCAQHMVVRVEKTWRQLFSQKYRSVLDLVSKKADHSVLRLLQISQQHIESQLDRVRQERELMKEVLERRAMPMQMTLPLKDPNTGMPMQGFGWPMPGLPLYDANGETVRPPPKRVAQRPAGAPAPKAQAATPREVPP